MLSPVEQILLWLLSGGLGVRLCELPSLVAQRVLQRAFSCESYYILISVHGCMSG